MNGASFKLRSMVDSILLYCKPIFGIADNISPKNYLYALWVILCFPMFIIITNDLLVNMIDKKQYSLDTVDDLLRDDVQAFTYAFKVGANYNHTQILPILKK